MNKFVYVEINILKQILTNDIFNRTMDLYKKHTYWGKYVKLMTGGFNYTTDCYLIQNLKSNKKLGYEILFEVPEEHAKSYKDIKEENMKGMII